MATINFNNNSTGRGSTTQNVTLVEHPIKGINGCNIATWADQIDWGEFDLKITNGNQNSNLVANSYNSFIDALKANFDYLYNLIQNINIPTDSYSITWNGNGATTAASGGSISVTSGSAVTLPTTNPKREHTISWNANGGSGNSGGSNKVTYTFNNWWTSSSGGTQVTSNTKPTGNVTYYAHWTVPSSITLPTTNPSRSGYTFKGWATSSNATSSNVTSSTIATSNVTYYAVWEAVQQTYYYYYYAGWTLPTESNVDTIITETYPTSRSDSTQHAAGKKTTSKSTMDYTSINLYNANQKTNYYVLVPPNHAIYDSLGNNVISGTFTLQGTINVGNQQHTIYKSNPTSRGINAIIIR